MNDIDQSPNQNTSKATVTYSSVLSWTVLILGILVSLAGWQLVNRYEERVAVARFHTDARERFFLIRAELKNVSSALEDLASMYAVNDTVTAQQFSRFVAPILAREPALRGMGWNQVVMQSQRATHESAFRNKGMSDYRITQRSFAGTIETAAQRQIYVVVTLIEPLEHNRSALGYDVASEATRRNALERARDTATLGVAAPINLVQTEGKSLSAIGFIPRYRIGSNPQTIAERRANLEGFFTVVVDMNSLIATAFSNLKDAGIALKIKTTAPGMKAESLFVSDQFKAEDTQAPPSELGRGDLFGYSPQLAWGGHDLDFQFMPSKAYRAAVQSWVPTGVLVGSLALTVLLAALIRLLHGRSVRIVREVADRTQELREANLILESEIERRTKSEIRLEAHQQDLEREVAKRTTELKASAAHLRTVLETEPECVKLVSAEGCLEDMNAAGLAMIEADSIESVRGTSVYSLVDIEHRDAFIKLNRRVIAGESGTLEFKLRGLCGGERWVETNAVPLIDPVDGSTRHLAITRDITAKKAAMKESVRLQAQLRHTQKLESIGVLAGGIAHDFNNFLQVIIGNNEIALEDASFKGRTRQSLELSQSAATDAAKLCDQMLTYAGKSKPQFQSIVLPRLVESIANLLEVSRSKNAELELVFEGTQHEISGDDSQLQQLVMNLVTNASEAIGDVPGHIVVTIRSINLSDDLARHDWIGAAPPDGQYISLEVKDSGCGMSAKVKERMFDPFFTTKVVGRGLGLSSALGIAQSHDGFLKVVSEVGQGTQITVLFPVSKPIEPVAPPTEKQPTSFDQTVLLVDDNSAVRRVAQLLLTNLGFRVVEAANGDEAVTYFARHSDDIDVVLLDVAMPKMNGKEACVKLRQIRPDIPVIFCSGYAPDAIKPDADAMGHTGFLHKPYRRDQLIDAFKDALGHQVRK